MTFLQRQSRKRFSLALVLVMLGVYYLIVFRPLVQKEHAQLEPFEVAQTELQALAKNNPVVSSMSLNSLSQLETTLRQSIASSVAARDYIRKRYAPEPSIATNLSRTFQLIDYQNERAKRWATLKGDASGKNVTLRDEVITGLPELTSETKRKELLWAQLGLVDAILRTAVAVGVDSVDDVRVPEPVFYPPVKNATNQLAEIPVRVKMSGDWYEITHALGVLLLDEPERKKLNLTSPEGLPGMSLRHIIARKGPPDENGTIQLDVEFSGFLDVPVLPSAADYNPGN